jgi:hypothetical protein
MSLHAVKFGVQTRQSRNTQNNKTSWSNKTGQAADGRCIVVQMLDHVEGQHRVEALAR